MELSFDNLIKSKPSSASYARRLRRRNGSLEDNMVCIYVRSSVCYIKNVVQ